MSIHKVLILDFGSQYTQLIARKVRELNIFSEILPYNQENIPSKDYQAIILSGSPYSCLDNDAPLISDEIINSGKPILGICYSAQFVAHKFGGEVSASSHREYGRAIITHTNDNNLLFQDIDTESQVWMSHGDTIISLPSDAKILASTQSIDNAAYFLPSLNFYGVQFHPEVHHTSQGNKLLENFLVKIARCSQDWTPAHFISETVEEIKNKVGDNQVVMAISGGVDSSVAAYLVNQAIGKNLHCVFVDNGLLRKKEFENVLESYKQTGLNVIGIDAKDEFYSALKGIQDPEAKRKAIGKTFIDVFDREAKRISNISWLCQGTIYPDVIESFSTKGPSVTIKSHHNVGGLPKDMKLKVLEPIRLLFKDEVRRVGAELGVPSNILERHPFPGPGLAIRILGEVNHNSVEILQKADDIFIEQLKTNGLYNQVWQAGVILLNVNSVGVMGDSRTYENVVCLRAVSSVDGMTADWVHLPYDFLANVSNKIINNVKGINRVVYDISSKPPATIEWE